MDLGKIAKYINGHKDESPDSIYAKMITTTALAIDAADIESLHAYTAVQRLTKLDANILEYL